MTATSSLAISAEHISVPEALPAFVHSLIGVPNNPASLYLSINPRSLIIYVAPASTVNVINLSHLSVALRQENGSASALKTLLETGTTTKVFFDARIPAKVLFECCGIKLSNETCTAQTSIHEVQMMELALRRRDPGREWLAGLDKCITQDSGLEFDKLTLEGGAEFDKRILHLPVLWKKYHDQLVGGRFGVGGSFWVAMIREATQKRLEASRCEKHGGYDADSARSGWDRDSIEEQGECWNEDVMMDADTEGEFLGGAEHWAKFDLL